MTLLAALLAVVVAAALLGVAYGLGRAAGESPIPPRFYRPRFRYGVGPARGKGIESMLELNLTNEQKVKITVTPTTQGGHAAAIDGEAVFTVQVGDCTIEPIDDGSAFIVSGDNPGDSVILVQADADLGEGVQTIADTVNVHVSGAPATSLGLAAGSPEPK